MQRDGRDDHALSDQGAGDLCQPVGQRRAQVGAVAMLQRKHQLATCSLVNEGRAALSPWAVHAQTVVTKQ